MKDTWIKKGVVISVILLFVGVAVAPSINQSVVKASQDDDLVEVTTQACGIQGYGDTTVKLTRQQYSDLEQYLTEFKARLNQTSSREEAVSLFKEAVVKLNKYGLLPRGMNVERAQKLVTGLFSHQRFFYTIMKLLTGKQRNFAKNENWCCTFLSHTNFMLLDCMVWRLFGFGIIGNYLYNLQKFFIWCPIDFAIVWPKRDGWVDTVGLNGIKSWKGNMIGEIINNGVGRDTGVIGFTGIKIGNGNTEYMWLIGTAFHVKINYTDYVP
jgi:hypothetical protein